MDKKTLDKLWLLLCDLQDTLPEHEDRTEDEHETWTNINTVMAYVDNLSGNLEEESK